jgi:hypothetical protein
LHGFSHFIKIAIFDHPEKSFFVIAQHRSKPAIARRTHPARSAEFIPLQRELEPALKSLQDRANYNTAAHPSPVGRSCRFAVTFPAATRARILTTLQFNLPPQTATFRSAIGAACHQNLRDGSPPPFVAAHG